MLDSYKSSYDSCFSNDAYLITDYTVEQNRHRLICASGYVDDRVECADSGSTCEAPRAANYFERSTTFSSVRIKESRISKRHGVTIRSFYRYGAISRQSIWSRCTQAQRTGLR